MTLVSVVTPSFNQAAFLRRAMRSVLSQEYAEIEYIVVDGGSSDGSADIVREFSPRLAWWVSERDAGQAEAINKGMSRASGQIAAWLNSDDYYLPGAVASAVRAFEAHPEAVLVYANMQAVDDQDRVLNLLTYDQITLEDLLCFSIIGQPATFMRRSAFEAAGGLDASLHLLLDHHLWIRLARLGSLVHIPALWAAARYHSAAKNRALAGSFGREAFRILDWAESQSELAQSLGRMRPRARASAHRVNARYMLDAGEPARALRAWLRSFGLHPPTAIGRLNVAAAAGLELAGLGALRAAILRRRRDKLAG